MKSILTKNQKKTFTKTGVMVDGQKVDITAKVRYDDECGNGHNSFSITGKYYEHGKPKTDRYMISCGCVHEAIEQAFPELVPFIKWHLTSSDEPMHYAANTTYHARTCSHDGKKVGEPVRFKEVLLFGDLPIEFKEPERGFFEFLKGCDSKFNLVIEPIEHDNKPTGYQFKPKYTYRGFSDVWHNCPFDTASEAHNFLEALQKGKPHFKQAPTEWAEAVEPNIEAARSCAVWPEATLEQLQDKEALLARLPELMAEFKNDVESLGFTY